MKVTFQIQGGEAVCIECGAGENLLELARRANVAMDAPCSGNGSCGKCRVQLLSGEVESAPSRHITAEEYQAGWRLSCCTKVVSDCAVLVPDIAGAYRSRIKTADLNSPREIAAFNQIMDALRGAGIAFTHGYKAVSLALSAPTLDDTMPDNERVTRAIIQATGCARVVIPYGAMARLARALRENGWKVCAKGLLQGEVFTLMDIAPYENTLLCAAAIDIGTTTVTAALLDLDTGLLLAKGSCGNAQIRYGADVINRIIQSGRPGGQKRLQEAIVEETLNPLLSRLCAGAGLDTNAIVRLCIGANTTMNHLLLGVDAQSVRMEPYIPSFFAWEDLKAGDIGLAANAAAPVVLAPNIGSYVGGDITAGTLAAGLWNSEEMCLFIDLGTNGEIVFGNREFMMSCACSAGPAFEGGDISCGMRSTDGAIEACTINGETMEPTLSVIGPEGQKCVGICGSGIIDVIAQLYRHGIINAKGLFVREGKRIRRDRHGMGRYILAFPQESETGREISLNEVDIDNFIRAKGAIYSAIDTMLAAVDMPVECIDRVYVAGGIGSGINMDNAVSIGMLPDVPREKFSYIGNASLMGSCAMACGVQAQEKCGEIATNMTYLELSTYPGYMDNFVAACFIPHTNAALFPSAL